LNDAGEIEVDVDEDSVGEIGDKFGDTAGGGVGVTRFASRRRGFKTQNKF
jgi:hypothetical protein